MRRGFLPLFAAALALLIPLLFVTSVAVPSWNGRHALLALEVAVGLPVGIALLRTRARAQVLAGLGFAAWALVSALLSPDHTTAFWGLFGWGTGLLFVLALVGCWAIGSGAGDDGRRWIQTALLAGALVNAGIAVLQSLVDLSTYHLELVDARPPGLLGNSVFLGALAAGAVWLAVLRPLRGWPARVACLVLLAAAVELSGSRVAFAVTAAALLAAFLTQRWRRAGLFALCLLIGSGIGLAAGHYGRTTTATGRSDVASGITPRVDTWLSARHAVVRHPILGSGPGRFRAATSADRTLAVARAEAPDRLFADAHNLLVEYTVTTGVPGVALLVLWLLLVLRRSGWRSPLAGFGIAVLATHAVQPQNVALTPLALLALGAARPVTDPLRVPLAPVRVVFGAAAAATATLLLVGSWHLQQTRLDFTVDEARQARRLLPAWPETDRQLAQALTYQGKSRRRPELLAQALSWRRGAATRDPTDPGGWNDLADAEVAVRMDAQARIHYRRALRHDPWSVRAFNGLAGVEARRGDRDEAIRLLRQSLLVAPDQRLTRQALARLEAGLDQ